MEISNTVIYNERYFSSVFSIADTKEDCRMDIAFLKTFLDVAKSHNFTKSAERLGYAQSSITAQIQKLEAAYGVSLFERIGKRMSLTHAGEQLHHYALQIVGLFEESIVAVREPCAGSFSIGTFDTTLASYLLPSYFGAFKKEFPLMNVVMREVIENDLLRAIRAGECDLGFLVGPEPQDSDFIFEHIREEDYVVIAPKEHPLAGRDLIRASDFGREDVILSQPGCFCRHLWESILRNNGIQYRVIYEISNFETIKNCVVHGLGLAFVPRSVAEPERNRCNLAILPLEGQATRLPVHIVYHNRKRISPPIRHFIDSLRA